jgi:DNA (cytosine-5)-methyltransferase 1
LLGRAVATQIAAALGVTPNKPTAELQLGDPQLLTFDMGGAAHYFSVPRNTIAQRRLNRPDKISRSLVRQLEHRR